MNSTWKYGMLSAAMAVAISGTLVAQKGDDPNSHKASAADIKFARDAAMGGKAEVELGKVAVQKASNDKVKEFGQRMIDDHGKGGDELKSVAAKENIEIPGDLDAKHQAMVNKYSNLSGAAFDRAYMRDMVKDHEEDIAEFQKEAASGSNYSLKNWAGATLPTLREHLRMAKEAENSLGATSSK